MGPSADSDQQSQENKLANISYTPIFKLPMLNKTGVPVTPEMEIRRYVTLDVQLEALYSVLGDGIISGWEITTTPPPETGLTQAPPNTIYISAGSGNVGRMRCESLEYTTLGGLAGGTSTFPGINHIYATITDNSPLTKEVHFFTSNTPLKQDNVVAIGLVTIQGSTVTINTSDRVPIGFLSVLLTSLVAHHHGKDGISAIDLSSEVKGVLSSENIGDIPAGRITSGIVDPARFSLSHLALLDTGQYTHEDLDSIVEGLRKTNKKLFGDISASNLIQLALATKQTLGESDRYFRNMILIVPGYDNCTFDNSKSWIDPESAIPQNLFDKDPTIRSFSNSEGKTVELRADAALVDFNKGRIKGIVASGRQASEISIDTAAEFSKGRYNPLYLTVGALTGPYAYVYGYGYAGGDGIDYFDAFGIASGATDENGNPMHVGYAGDEFESEYTGRYSYTYGYEYVSSGAFFSGHVGVTLLQGVSTYVLYSTDGHVDTDVVSSPAPPHTINYPDSSRLEETANIEDENIYWTLMERFKYTPPSFSSGDISPAVTENARLVYRMDTSNVSMSKFYDWKDCENINLKFLKNENVEPIPVVGNWTVTLTDADGATISIDVLGMQDGDLLDFKSDDLVLPISLNNIDQSIDVSMVAKIALQSDAEKVFVTETVNAIECDVYLHSISIGTRAKFPSEEAKTKIDQLYFAIPEASKAHLESISWVSEEPSDSRVLFYVKSADATSNGSDGFSMLRATDTFGSSYTNKSRGEGIRPSGSDMTEPDGTHFELKVVLQPSQDGNFTPILRGVTIRYSTAGTMQEITFSSDEDFNIGKSDVDAVRTNIEMTVDSQLQIHKIENVKSRVFGCAGRFEQLVLNRLGLYEPSISASSAASKLPKTFSQYLDTSASSGYSRISAIRKLSNQDFVMADTDNHRICRINGQSGVVEWVLSGSSCYGSTEILPRFRPVFAHFNRKESALYVSFTHTVSASQRINLENWHIIGSNGSAMLSNSQAAPESDVASVINSNILGGTSGGGGLVKVSLGTRSLSSIARLSGALRLTIDSRSVSSTVTSEKDDPSFWTNVSIDEYSIYYDQITNPVDLKVDSEDNLLIAQAIESNSPSGSASIIKLSMKSPSNFIYSFKAASDGKELRFNKTYFGSAEEFVDETGNKELLIADFDNQRVVRLNTDSNKTLLWQVNTTSKEGRASIPSYLFPTCATRGPDGRFYIALVDKQSGLRSRVIVVTNDLVLSKTILSGEVGKISDVYFVQKGNKLLIST